MGIERFRKKIKPYRRLGSQFEQQGQSLTRFLCFAIPRIAIEGGRGE